MSGSKPRDGNLTNPILSTRSATTRTPVTTPLTTGSPAATTTSRARRNPSTTAPNWPPLTRRTHTRVPTSAPESEHFTSGPYLPADLRLYDYEDYDESADEDERSTARWPWVVGIAAIVAAIALVVSVSLLFARTDTTKLANPNTTTAPSTPPMQDEITTTKPPPPPPPPPTTEPPPPPTATETQTVTVTPSPAPPPPPTPAPAPPATSTAAAPPPPTTPAGPRQVTYSVTGTKAQATSFR